MKVVSSGEDELVFDNGVSIVGNGDVDCCAQNYIDFDQFEVGEEFPDMTAGQLIDAMSLKDDGFSIKASNGISKWAQARSIQNGYYSNRTTLIVKDGSKSIEVARLEGCEQY